MSPGAELTFAVIGGGAALVGVLVTLTRAFSGAISTVVREEVTPIVEKFTQATSELTTQMMVLRTSFEASQVSQDRGNQEMSKAVQAIRERLDEHGEQIAALDERTQRLVRGH